MGDHRIFVDNLRFNYEGVFSANEFFRTMSTYLYEKGYDKHDVKEFEQHTPTGKHIEWYAHPWKKVSDYMRLEMTIRILISDMVKKEVVLNKKKQVLDHGKILIIINGYMETDYDMRWEHKPMFHFFHTIFDKWVFKNYLERWEYIFSDHVNQLYALIRKHFNVYDSHGLKTLPNSIALHDAHD